MPTKKRNRDLKPAVATEETGSTKAATSAKGGKGKHTPPLLPSAVTKKNSDDVFDPNLDLFEEDSDNDEKQDHFEDGEPSEDLEETLAEHSDDDDSDLDRTEEDGDEVDPGDHIYASDSSDEEAYLDVNKVGNIPMEWYDEYDHIGYDLEGQKVLKAMPKDELEKFLQTNDGSGQQWLTVWDEKNGRDVVLTKKQFDILKRIQKARFPEKSTEEFETVVYPFPEGIHPVSNRPEPKSRFVPSKWEARRIAYLVKAIRKGWIKLDEEKEKEKKAKEATRWYLLWDEQKEETEEESGKKKREGLMRAPPPKMRLPSHVESYRPPAEYLLTAEEQRAWEEMDPSERPTAFLPKSFDRLLHVPLYSRNIRERFERCLDLYLCPRVAAKPLRVPNKEALLPKLPKPRELKPFPTTLAVQYLGHSKRIKGISVSPNGQWLVSGGDDKTLRVWHVDTGRCMKVWKFAGKVFSVAWNPNPELNILAAAVEDMGVLLVNPRIGSEEQIEAMDTILTSRSDSSPPENGVKWQKVGENDLFESGVRLQVTSPSDVKLVTWHGKGDYLASVAPDAGSQSVMIHRLSQHQTQTPFKKNKGQVSCVRFHPTKPLFFVATARYIRVYNLMRQSLWKKLNPGVNEISSLDIHPQGDNLIMGSYDTRVNWFDLDLSVKPYKILRYHKEAVNQVAYHKKYPLFASASDDGALHIFHGMVYNDLLENALIVPVNILKGHEVSSKGDGVTDCVFHPTQPWVFSAGGDGVINLYSSN